MKTNSALIAGLALNFEGGTAPDMVQLTPPGPNVDGRDGRKWILPNPEAVIAAFRDHGADLPIDIEHATQLKAGNGEPAPAVGWITDMEVRDGALWGAVNWTEDGARAVSSGAYRYLSPAFRFEQARGEILRMTSAGLTNQPNLHLEALNRESEEGETGMDPAIAEALGLNANATAADAVVAIGKLAEARDTALNSAKHPDPASFVPMADHQLALNRIKGFEEGEKTRQGEAITAALDEAIKAGKIAPASREYHEATCRQEGGLARFQAFVEAQPALVPPSGLAGKTPDGGRKLTDDELAICHQLGMTEEDFLADKKKEA